MCLVCWAIIIISSWFFSCFVCINLVNFWKVRVHLETNSLSYVSLFFNLVWIFADKDRVLQSAVSNDLKPGRIKRVSWWRCRLIRVGRLHSGNVSENSVPGHFWALWFSLLQLLSGKNNTPCIPCWVVGRINNNDPHKPLGLCTFKWLELHAQENPRPSNNPVLWMFSIL